MSFTDTSGRILSITTGLAINDILVIDSENKKVFKNSVEIDYT